MKKNYVDGILEAMVFVAEVTGKQSIADMSEREWKLIRALNEGLIRLALRGAESIEKDNDTYAR